MSKPLEYADNSRAEHRTLRILTEKCLDLFIKCQTIPNLSETTELWFEDNLAKLRWWAFGLGVQKLGPASLDYRLKDNDDVRKVVSNLLNGLVMALERYLAGGFKRCDVLPDQDEFNSISNDEPPKDLKPINSVLTDGSGSSNIRKIDTMLGEQAYYIDMHLRNLARLSLLIRKSGDKFRHRLADADLENADSGLKSEYEQFRNYLTTKILCTGSLERALLIKLGAMVIPYPYATSVKLIIHARLRNRLTPIQARLIQANVMRRHRLRFARSRSEERVEEKSAPSLVDKPTAPSQSRIEPINPKSKSSATLSNSKLTTPAAPVPQPKDRAPDDRTATGAGPEMHRKITQSEKAKSAPSHVTLTGQALDYPAPPNLGSDPRCPYCSFVLTPEHGISKNKWRGHLAHDLSPYTCIFENCDTPLNLYVTREQWMSHITTYHSVTQWICSLCFFDLKKEDLSYETADEWHSHMEEEHAGKFEPIQLSLLCELSKKDLVPPVSCPLCLDDHQRLYLESNDHIAEHLKLFSLYALPWDIGEDNDTNPASAAHVFGSHSCRSTSYPEITEEALIDMIEQTEELHQRTKTSQTNETDDDFFTTKDLDKIGQLLSKMKDWARLRQVTSSQRSQSALLLGRLQSNLQYLATVEHDSDAGHARDLATNIRLDTEALEESIVVSTVRRDTWEEAWGSLSEETKEAIQSTTNALAPSSFSQIMSEFMRAQAPGTPRKVSSELEYIRSEQNRSEIPTIFSEEDAIPPLSAIQAVLRIYLPIASPSEIAHVAYANQLFRVIDVALLGVSLGRMYELAYTLDNTPENGFADLHFATLAVYKAVLTMLGRILVSEPANKSQEIFRATPSTLQAIDADVDQLSNLVTSLVRTAGNCEEDRTGAIDPHITNLLHQIQHASSTDAGQDQQRSLTTEKNRHSSDSDSDY
ncbi:hypothetical protein GGR51DRAFT_563611 [Nemania sp. FL0031]|nr:hypothetical protein GGR51DRAFT_563611 [Nemania sp. FL0031]